MIALVEIFQGIVEAVYVYQNDRQARADYEEWWREEGYGPDEIGDGLAHEKCVLVLCPVETGERAKH